MKLSNPQQQKVEAQLGVEAIAEENPAAGKLKEVFGDHTFFVDAEGLNIVEPDPEPESAGGTVIKLASWTEDRTQLRVHEPQLLGVAVEFETDGSDPTA